MKVCNICQYQSNFIFLVFTERIVIAIVYSCVYLCSLRTYSVFKRFPLHIMITTFPPGEDTRSGGQSPRGDTRGDHKGQSPGGVREGLAAFTEHSLVFFHHTFHNY